MWEHSVFCFVEFFIYCSVTLWHFYRFFILSILSITDTVPELPAGSQQWLLWDATWSEQQQSRACSPQQSALLKCWRQRQERGRDVPYRLQGGLLPRSTQGWKTLSSGMQELLYKGGSWGGYRSSTNRDRTGEDHKAGFTIHKPMRMHGGGNCSHKPMGLRVTGHFQGDFQGRGLAQMGLTTQWDKGQGTIWIKEQD